MAQVAGLDHVGIAVEDLDEAVETFEALLGEDAEVHRIDPGKEYDDDGNVVEEIRFAYLGAGNDVMLELMQPGTVGEGAIGSYLEANGEGIHHISFWVEPKSEFGQFFETLSDLGFATVGDEPWRSDPSAERDNVYTYLHPKSTHGTLIELISPYEVEDGVMQTRETAADAGLDWADE
ncbi:VOC family protein [Halovivax limisalsi]|uniref:VOC family protein n=1 Tax=Halovivax limisalsi TaxID=1453760 RepID=UPI001FFC7907|nr:VOC family protein [Halovivax limisalsi]